ncbi:MAG: outer membrane protein assembly factor BamE [Planctomycetota bacterium]
MPKFLLVCSTVLASLLAAGCSSSAPRASAANGPAVGPNATAALVGGPGGQIRVGGKYWARTNLRIVGGKQIDHESWVTGDLVTMGTAMTVMETAKDDTRWRVKFDDGREVWIFVGYGAGFKDQYQEIQKFLAAQDPKADFDAGSGDIADGIKFGRPVVGMSRAQVLAACGFPPKVTDPATSDQWRYPQLGAGWRTHGWFRGYNQHNVTLEFSGEKVVRVLGLELE